MFDFLDNPVVTFLVFGIAAAFFLFDAIMKMPDARDKKTKEKRTYYQRWKIAPRSVRRDCIIGCLWAVASVASGAEIIVNIVSAL